MEPPFILRIIGPLPEPIFASILRFVTLRGHIGCDIDVSETVAWRWALGVSAVIYILFPSHFVFRIHCAVFRS